MNLSSLSFIYFVLPLTLCVYYIIPSKFTVAKNIWLTVASLVFYSMCEPTYFVLLLFSIVLNWGLGLLIQKSPSKKNPWVRIGVVLNILMLLVFKLISTNVNLILTFAEVDRTLLALPVGLSFYTFHAISYLVDINRKKAPAAKNPLDTALYLSFFVKVISGPLVSYADFQKQLGNRKTTFGSFSEGLWKFLIGLGKQVIVATPLSAICEAAFDAKGDISVTLAWLGTLAYFLQVYLDFSGYSDMAIGLGRMLGFDIPENFKYPYLSKTVAEYWRRWHITLGAWFRSYVFFPVSVSPVCLKINKLSRKRFGASAGRLVGIALPLFVVWSLTGLWHDFSMRYLLWGIINGVFIIWETARKPFKNKKAETVFGHIYTVAIAFFTKVLVRSSSIKASFVYFGTMFGVGADVFMCDDAVLCLREYAVYLILGIVLCFPVAQTLKKLIETKAPSLIKVYNVASALGLAAVTLITLAMLVQNGANPFIYGKF